MANITVNLIEKKGGSNKVREIGKCYYYTVGNVQVLINRNYCTIIGWDNFSDLLEQRGTKRLIPKPLRVNGIRYYTKEQVEEIRIFSVSKKRGLMAEYYRGKRGKKSKSDKTKV